MPTKKVVKQRKDMTPLERSIHSRERGIARMRDNIERIRKDAEAKVSTIQARIAEKQVLLDALKRGAMKVG